MSLLNIQRTNLRKINWIGFRLWKRSCDIFGMVMIPNRRLFNLVLSSVFRWRTAHEYGNRGKVPGRVQSNPKSAKIWWSLVLSASEISD